MTSGTRGSLARKDHSDENSDTVNDEEDSERNSKRKKSKAEQSNDFRPPKCVYYLGSETAVKNIVSFKDEIFVFLSRSNPIHVYKCK